MSKRAERARRRAARYADRGRRAATAAQRHDVAREYLLAAVGHAPAADRLARGLAAEYGQVVRDLVQACGLDGGRGRGRLYLEQLDLRRDPRPRLAQTLRLLRAAADQHPAADRVHNHYADQLTEQARRIDAHHLRRGGDRG